MASYGSLEDLFEKPLPDNPTFLGSFTPWQTTKINDEDSSLKENFNDSGHVHSLLHEPSSTSSSPFSQSSPSSSLSSNSIFSTDIIPSYWGMFGISKWDKDGSSTNYQEKDRSSRKDYRHSDSFSSMSSESLSICTEGLGSESSDDIEDLLGNDYKQCQEERKNSRQNPAAENHWKKLKRSRTCGGAFPPPISCIGRCGKPWVCFKSFREDGRFILKEVRIPAHELLHSCRENGRLMLKSIELDEENLEDLLQKEEIVEDNIWNNDNENETSTTGREETEEMEKRIQKLRSSPSHTDRTI